MSPAESAPQSYLREYYPAIERSGEDFDRQKGLARRRGPEWRDIRGGLVGGNIGGKIFFSGPVQLGNPDGTNFPQLDLHRGAALLALPGDQLFDFARTQVPGDVHMRALLQAGRELGEIGKAGDAMPVGVGVPLTLGVFPGPLGGEREDGEWNAVPDGFGPGVAAEVTHNVNGILVHV